MKLDNGRERGRDNISRMENHRSCGKCGEGGGHRARRRKALMRLTITLGSDEADEVVRAGYNVRAEDPEVAAEALRLFLSDMIALRDVHR